MMTRLSSFRASCLVLMLSLFAVNAGAWAQDPCDGVPQADIALLRDQLQAPVALLLSAGGSTDCDGAVVAWDWAIDTLAPRSGETVPALITDPGQYTIGLTVTDDAGNQGTASTTVEVLEAFCPIMPVTIEAALLAGAAMGQAFDQIPVDTGPGNFSELTWTGVNNEGTLAASLAQPGDSFDYINPDDPTDHLLTIGDWVEGKPGVTNATGVRAALDLLLGQSIVIPTHGETRDQGANFDYQVVDFVRVELTDYSLSGQGYFSFVYGGDAHCYDPRFEGDYRFQTPEDTPLDIELAVVQPQTWIEPQHGELSGPGPQLTYTPAPDYFGPDRFTLLDQGDLVTVVIDVLPVIDPPIADPQSVTTLEDTAAAVTLTGSPGEGGALDFEIVSQPASGVLSGDPPAVVYAPDADFFGIDSFEFRVVEGSQFSVPATVSITVTPVNDGPIANGQDLVVVEDQVLAIVLDGFDVDGDALQFVLSSLPANGTLSGTPPNLSYTPAANFFGADGFDFLVSDGELDSAPAAVTITVTPENDAPSATPQSIAVDEDQTVPVSLSGADVENDALTFSVVAPPANGTLTGSAPDLIYAPNPDFNGSDGFQFVANDGLLDSAPAAVTIAVNPVNDPPSAQAGAVSVDEDTSAAITVVATDVDNDPLTYTVVSAPANGTLTGTGPDFNYQPNADFNGSDSFTVVVSDGTVDADPVVVAITVNPVNDPPVANGQNVETDEDEPIDVTLTGSDIDGDALSFGPVTAPANGALSGTPPNLSYQPNPGFFGLDAFDFIANDGSVDSAPATVMIQVNEVNTLPTADDQSVMIDEDTQALLTLSGSDPDGDPLTFTLVAGPSNGTLSGATPDLTYTPATDFNGLDSLVFVVNDGTGDSDPATVTITVAPVNDAPLASAAPVTLDEDTSTAITVVATDVDGDPLTFTVVSAPANGTLTGAGPDFSYQPDPDFNGSDSFTVVVSDGTVDADPVVIAITVNPVNDPPVALPQSLVLADTSLAITLSGTDVDGDALSFSIVMPPANGTLSGTAPGLTYAPDPGFAGIDSFTFVANDGLVDSAPASVTIDVQISNGAPQITSSPPLDGAEGELYTYQVEATDPDGDVLSFSLPTAPPDMSIDEATGLIAWTPLSDTLGAVAVTVRVEDPQGGSDQQQWVITVPGSTVNRSYLGTDFWLSFGDNFGVRGDAVATVSIAAPDGAGGNVQAPGLGLDIPFTVAAGGLERITLPDTVFAGSDGSVTNNGVHIASDAPVTVMAFNEGPFTTDSAQVFPTAVLAQDYTVPSYNNFALALMYLVATEDDTTVIITPSPGVPFMRANGVQNQSTFSLELNRGEVYQSIPLADLTGTTLRASKPIAVFSGNSCADVPDGIGTCDHLFEQVAGDRHAAGRYLTMPYATRFGGDYFRFVAIEDGTRVRVNDTQIALLNAGEFLDRIIDGPAEITASHPIYTVQMATGQNFDREQREADPNIPNTDADPFMVIVPPTTAYLDEYIFTTAPNDRLVSHYVNVIIPAAAVDSMILDGAPADTSGFIQIHDTDYVGGSLAVGFGTHTISADEKFGLTIYGWGPAESYGSNGNAVVGTLPPVDRLVVTPATQTQPVGANACVEITAKNPLDYAVPFVGVDVRVSGARTIEETIFTDAIGIATFCYIGIAAGDEVITLTSGPAFATAEVAWTPLPPGTPSGPIIVSLPPLTLDEATYSYDIDAVDANGDVITYSLVEGPAGMSVDPVSGLLSWTPPEPADHLPTRHDITVAATDPGGAQGTQQYELLVNYAPIFLSPFTPEESESISPQLTIEVAGGNPSANQIAILEAPPRANVVDDIRTNIWRFSTALSNSIDGDPFHIREAIEAFNPFCRAPIADLPELAADQVWASAQEMHRVVADALIDTDGNGSVDSADDLFVVGVSPHLTALNAATGALEWSVSGAAVIDVAPAIADLDGDRIPEVLAADDAPDGSRRLYAYDNQGALIWESAAPVLPGDFAATKTAIEVADLDGDGTVEIVVGPSVLDASGTLLWQFTTAVGAGVLEAFPWIADLDGDGSLEVLFGDEVRNADGTLRWSTSGAVGTSGSIAQFVVADLELDGQADVIASVFDGLGHALWVFERDGQLKWGPLPLADASLPAVADFDHDGAPEIYLSNDGLRVSASGQILGIDDSAADHDYFRAAVADLNDDGLYEVVRLRDRTRLQIIDLLSGLLWSDDTGYFESAGRYGGLAIVDADRDGHVEILVGGSLSRTRMVQPLRSEWRDGPLAQPSYGLTASGNEAGIAVVARDRDLTPDLWIGKLRASEAGGSYMLSARVTNRGPGAAASSTTVEFYRGDPDLPGAALLGSVVLGPLGGNQSLPVTLGSLTRLQVSGDIVARLVTTETECETRNNTVATPVYELEVFDGPNRRDRLLFLPGLLERVVTPPFSSTPLTQAAVGSTYAYDPVIEGLNVGDAPRFRLSASAPAGVIFNPDSGQIRWTPTSADIGSHSFTLTYRNLSERSRVQGVSINVVATSNGAPVITSTPVIVAAFDTLYAYDVVASDPDGDPLTFSLGMAPAGMTIDPVSGLIQWTPTAADAGQHPVSVTASDGQGGQAVQDYALTVGATLNSPPVIEGLPSDQAKQSKLYRDFIIASDPDGDPLTFTKLDGPSVLSINATTGEVSYFPPNSFSGLTTVVFEVTDGTYTVQGSWMITVAPRLQPLGVMIELSTDVAVPDETVGVAVAAVAAAGPYTLSLSMDGADVPLDDQGEATISAGQPGLRGFVATAVDQAETAQATAELLVVDPTDTVPPVVAISAPLDGAIITAPTPMLGDVIDDNLAFWRVLLTNTGTHAGQQEISRGTTTGTGIDLGTLDPTLLHNGAYGLILEATDFGGNVVNDAIGVLIEGNMKVGHFSITLEDVSIDMVGIPLQVTRTYDTRQRGENLDFGYGWSIDYQNLRLSESRAPGRSWRIDEDGGALGETCARPNGSPYVVVTLPGGEVQRFKAQAIPECKSSLEFVVDPFWELGFEPIGDTTAELEQNSYGLLRVIGGHLVDLGAPDEPADPRFYRLTTQEGMIFELDEGFGIRVVVDPNGNQLSYSDSGIVHSAGKQLDFVRDGQGRISDIILPNGEMLGYAYDQNGDLVAVTDQVNRTADYTYQSDHLLLNLEDLRGTRVSTNEYDADGRLIAIVDGGNKRIELTHDVTGRTEQVRDRLGNLTTYAYNERGNVTSETNALGETVLRTYDDEDNQLTETDPLGHTTTWTYDGRGNQLTEENPEGEVTTFTYSDRSQVLTQTDHLGHVVITNEYDMNGNISLSTDALGNQTDFVVGNQGQTLGLLFRITDAEGGETSYTYDSSGNRTTETDPDGNVTEWSYDENNNVISETRRRVNNANQVEITVTTYEYDAKDRRISTLDSLGNVTTTVYDGADNVTRETDARGNAINYSFDTLGRLIIQSYPDFTGEGTTYDAEGRITIERDRLNRQTRMSYDAAGRLIETIYPDDTPFVQTDNARTSNEYDAAGRLTATVDERGNRTEYEYDLAGRRTLVRDALLRETTFSYDERGLRIAMTDANGHTTKFVYDAAGRLIETIHPDDTPADDTDNPRTLVGYDGLGRKVSETDELGRTTQFEYDGRGNLTAVINALGQRTEYGYDGQGNKVSQTDALGRVTQWEYDRLGRVISRTLPLGQAETHTYDEVGNTDTRTDFNGHTTEYRYDENNRLTETIFDDFSTRTQTYLANGLVDAVTDPRGVTDYDYDERDRLTRITYPGGRTIEYQYDLAGNRSALITANQSVVYGFDGLNRMQSVTDDTGTTTYAYDLVGNRARIDYPNGTATTYGYDPRNRLTRMDHSGPTGNNLLGLSYVLNQNGTRAQIIEDTGRQTTYTYDALNRLTEEAVIDPNRIDRTTTWVYDAVGNRLSQDDDGVLTSYTYNANDHLLTETTAGDVSSYIYDANGNTRQKRVDGVTEATYQYDFEDRMVEADTGTQVSYTYDENGIRQSQNVAGTVTDFVVDPNQSYAQVIEELDGLTGESLVIYTHGDDLIAQQRIVEGNTSFYHYDGLGSTRLLTDPAGAVANSYVFAAFGTTEDETVTVPNLYLFTGEQLDPNVGFYYLRARYHNQEIGRFHTMDTFLGKPLDPLSLHKYLYVHANAPNAIDPTGRILGGFVSATINITVRVGITLRGAAVVSAVRLAQLQAGGAGVLAVLGARARNLLGRTGNAGIRALQDSVFSVAQRGQAITAAQAARAITINSNSVLNRILGFARNPTKIEYHHIVTKIPANLRTYGRGAINSLANLVPTPVQVHRAITGIYNTNVAGGKIRNLVGALDYSQQFVIGSRIWAAAMRYPGKLPVREACRILIEFGINCG